MTEPYSTPEEFDCWFCGERQKRNTQACQQICDRMVCEYCSIDDEAAAKINALDAERCAELVKLRRALALIACLSAPEGVEDKYRYIALRCQALARGALAGAELTEDTKEGKQT